MEKLNKYITSNWKYLNKSLEIEPNQHRLFKVLSIRETYVLVMDWELEETYPYKISHYEEGEFIILKINRKFPGRMEMEDSVLNFMLEDGSTTFKISHAEGNFLQLEESESSFSFLCQTEKPIHKNRKKFNFQIKGFDLDRNLPILDEKGFQTPISDPLTHYFDFGKKILAEVKQIQLEDGKVVITVLHQHKEFIVSGFSCQLQGKPIKQVELVLALEQGKIKLKQERGFLVQSRYQKETLDSFYLLERELHPDRNKDLLIFEDEFGYKHTLLIPDFLTPKQMEDFQPGRYFKLWIKEVYENGTLVLFINHLGLNKNQLITPAQLFEEIGRTDFYEQYFPELQKEFSSTSSLNHTSYKNPFDLLNKEENLWILSFGNWLDTFVDNLIFEEKSADAQVYLEILIALEKWLLEARNFLENFKPENQSSILQKAQEQINLCQHKLQVLLEIKESKHAVIKKLQTLCESSEIQDKDSREKIQLYLFCLPIEDVENSNALLNLTIKLLQKQPADPIVYTRLSKTLEKYNVHFRSQLNLTGREAYWGKDQLNQVKEKLQLSIRIQAVQINLDSKLGRTDQQVHRSSRICRFISLIHWNQEQAFVWIKRSIKVVTAELTLKIPLDRIANLEENYAWLGSYLELQLLACNSRLKLRYANGGVILRENRNWKVFGSAYQPQVSFNPQIASQKISSFFDDSIQVHVLGNPKIHLDDTVGASQLAKNWKDYFQGNSDEYEFRFHKKGETLSVEFQSYLNSNTNLGFVKILDSPSYLQGGLHILQVSSVHLKGLDGLFFPGDRFKARFHAAKNQKAQISVKEDLIELMKEKAGKSKQIVFKVLMINNQIAYGISHEGFYTSFNFENNDPKPEENKYYLFLPHTDQSHGYDFVQGILAHEVVSSFDEKEAVRSFIERHLLISKSTEVSKEEESIFHNYIQEVIWGVETMLNFPKIPDLTKLSYIYLAKLLSSIQKTAKSFYLDELANYYIFLIRVKDLGIISALESTKPISSETIRHFPKTAKINKIYEHVEYFVKAESKEEFIERINLIADQEEKELVEFLMAMWILQKQNAFGQKIMHRIFLTKLSIFGTEGNFQLLEEMQETKPEKPELPLESKLNLGREDKNQEFKSSIIFSAETSSANPELQQITILKTVAGFLNAGGGNLYIGVNDKGNVIGLREDFAYFGQKTNYDTYERKLRNLIIEFFNKDISSVIEIEMLIHQDLEYAKIKIPPYQKPVPLQNKFFQRQGNETRELLGSDLILFMERKFKPIPEPSEKEIPISKET